MNLGDFKNRNRKKSCQELFTLLSRLTSRLSSTYNPKKRKRIKYRIKILDKIIKNKCMKPRNKRRATQIATMYGTFLNQTGNPNPTLITDVFVQNMLDGYKKFGCRFLFNRRSVQQNTMMSEQEMTLVIE